jgi:plasmid maintenance system antidote protein VapI
MDFLICDYGCLAIPLESDKVSSMLFYCNHNLPNMKNIHIGSLIKEQFEKKLKRDKHFNKTVFAKLIHVHRSTIYPIFEQKSIDIDLLIRISKALEYNFIEEVYLKKNNDEKECKVIIGVEITKQQLLQLDFPDTLLVLLKANEENV